MTPDQLGEIREQHLPFEMPDGAILCEWCVDPWPCDAVALLTEVDRLTADLADTAAYAALGREHERARIRAVFEEHRSRSHPFVGYSYDVAMWLIDGDEK